MEEEIKIKNKNYCQISFFNYFIFKNYFQINSRKLFYKIIKEKHIQTHLKILVLLIYQVMLIIYIKIKFYFSIPCTYPYPTCS